MSKAQNTTGFYKVSKEKKMMLNKASYGVINIEIKE